jgi:methyl-accepting chemotaxis protein
MLPRFALDRIRLPTLDRSGVALISGLVTGAAALLAIIVLAGFGANLFTVALAIVLIGLGVGGSFLAGRMADRSFINRIAALRGLPEDEDDHGRGFEAQSVETVVADLLHRLDRAGQVRTAFSALGHPALLIGPGGVMAASRGLEQAIPGGVAGLDLNALAASDDLVAVGEQRYRVRRTAAGAGRTIIELLPAGHFVEEEDYEIFAAALSGQSGGVRFSRQALAGSPMLVAMQDAVERIDATVAALDHMAAGMFEQAAGPRLPESTRRLVKRLGTLLAEMGEARDHAETENARLEHRLAALEAALEAFSQTIAGISELVETGRDSVGLVEETLSKAREANERWTKIEREAVLAASDAAMAIRGGAIDKIEPLLDQLSEHLEILGNEQRMLQAMLGDGVAALGQIGEAVEGIGAHAERGLVRSAKRRVA